MILEPQAQKLADATSHPPFLYEIGVERARKVLDDIQAAPVPKLDVDEKWVVVPAAVGDVRVRIVKPVGASGPLPTILYVHGGGWVLGNAGTHDRLVRELAVGVNAAVAFVEYDRSPEARYPVAIEQAYATAQWITREGLAEGLDGTRLAVAGDSVGGNITAALAIVAKQRGDVRFVHQSMYYPVTDAAQDTDSYREFAEGPFLRARSMAWFWDNYCPDLARRSEITASPLRASLDELAGLPEAFVIVDENDVLRDEGEAYARKLIEAGVRTTSVRYNGIIHDFMMLNPVRETAAATAAIEQGIAILRKALGTDVSAGTRPDEEPIRLPTSSSRVAALDDARRRPARRSDAPDTIVLVHGLWVTPRSWEHWIEHYQDRGYRVLAPAYPGLDVEVEALNEDPSPIAALTIRGVIEHLERIVGGLERAPIIIGHSAGGLFTQLLLDRGHGAAGVVIDSAPAEGIRRTPVSQIRSLFPFVKNLAANRHGAVGFTPKQFHYAFANSLSREESDEVYARYHVPAPASFVWAGPLANLTPGHQDVYVNFRNGERAPLLFIGGGDDNLIPAAVNRANAKRYRHPSTITAYREFPGRCHFTLGQDGWEQVADYALAWAEAHVAMQLAA